MIQTTLSWYHQAFTVVAVLVLCCLLVYLGYQPVQDRVTTLASVLGHEEKQNATHVDVSDHAADHVMMTSLLPSHVTMEVESEACSDDKLAPNLETSTLAIQDPKKVYRIGDTIVVKLQLKNAFGKPITRGGAIIRARMFSEEKQAYSTGPITDHGTGIYTARFQALWTGNCTIKAKIAYSPETIRAILNFRQNWRSTRTIKGKFSVGSFTENTLCHATAAALLDSNYTAICNLTMDNSGMPWYCGKPSNIHLLCEDWTANRLLTPILQMTECERVLLSRSHKDMAHSLNVIVESTSENPSDVIQPATNPCREYDVSALWRSNQTTGFMYKNLWHLRHCKGFQKDMLFTCIRDTNFLIFGDSTTRQWLLHILKAWSCTQITETWTKVAWHKRAACRNVQHNFTVQWLPHSQPFLGGMDTIRYTRSSISRHLDEIGNTDKVVALIHMFIHTSAYHPSVLREKMKRVRASVDNLLRRNKSVKLFIKAPHTYYDTPSGKIRLSDYLGLIYEPILYEVFWGLHDRIVYLNNRDATDSIGNSGSHPPGSVVAGMVEQMLAYMC